MHGNVRVKNRGRRGSSLTSLTCEHASANAPRQERSRQKGKDYELYFSRHEKRPARWVGMLQLPSHGYPEPAQIRTWRNRLRRNWARAVLATAV